jgi:hypothetical protein
VALVACPFCRELFSRDETDVCPHCDLSVVALESLGPSAEALAEMPPLEQGDETLPWLSTAGQRGAVWLGSALGLGAFFAPWFAIEHPDEVMFSGLDLARGNAPWLWGGAIGYFLIFPLLLSRRTLNDLKRIRVITTTFAIMTACEVFVLWMKPPLESSYFRSGLEFMPAFGASGILSLLTAAASTFLGRARKGPEGPATPRNPGPRAESRTDKSAEPSVTIH